MRAYELFEGLKGDVPGNIQFYNNVHGFHHGQTDGTVYAYDPKKYPKGFDVSLGGVYGYLDWSSFEDSTLIKMIKVGEKYQRKGIATMMVNFLKNEMNEPIEWGMTTGSGKELRKALA